MININIKETIIYNKGRFRMSNLKSIEKNIWDLGGSLVIPIDITFRKLLNVKKGDIAVCSLENNTMVVVFKKKRR